MEDSKRGARRRHSEYLKARVLAACDEPGASVAQVAMAHGLNANLVHKWRRRVDRDKALTAPAMSTGDFIALPMPDTSAPAAVGADIRIELRRGAIAVNVSWPLTAAPHCAAWLRDVLR